MKNEKTTTECPDENVEPSRRKFLSSAAKLAVYTPPVMLAVSKPSLATFAESVDIREKIVDFTESDEGAALITRIRNFLANIF